MADERQAGNGSGNGLPAWMEEAAQRAAAGEWVLLMPGRRVGKSAYYRRVRELLEADDAER